MRWLVILVLVGCNSGSFLSVRVGQLPCDTSELRVTVTIDARTNETRFGGTDLADGETSFVLDLSDAPEGEVRILVEALSTKFAVIDSRLITTSDHAGQQRVDFSGGCNAQLCFGTGFGETCLAEPPSTPPTLPTTIDTDACAIVYRDTCVIAGDSIEVPAGTTILAKGSRPLVLIATGTITIGGTLSVSSTSIDGLTTGLGAGAGSASATCDTPAASAGGGSPGGSFGSIGGRGGAGGNTGQITNAAEVKPLASIRAGCPGGGVSAGSVLSGGAAGGAVYLIAGDAITVLPSGVVRANGQGGRPGPVNSGGSGGGSGGLIGLEASMIYNNGRLEALGGGGGGGGNTNNMGNLGNDGDLDSLGGPGATPGGGKGGNGARAGAAQGGSNGTPPAGGGGGGGGLGYIVSTAPPVSMNGTSQPPVSPRP